MKTCISSNCRTQVESQVAAWQASHAVQQKCAEKLALLLSISEDDAMDLLNRCDSVQEVLDHKGIEVIGDPLQEPIDYEYSESGFVSDDLPSLWLVGCLVAGVAAMAFASAVMFVFAQ